MNDSGVQNRIGVLLCGHGSRDPQALAEFTGVVKRIGAALPQYLVEHAYLELARPALREGLESLRRAGVRQVLAVPAMLMAAGHVKQDIPGCLHAYQADHPDVSIRYGRELGLSAGMLDAAEDRLRQAMAAANGPIPNHKSALVLVGRGSSDADANAKVAEIMSILQERIGFGLGQVCYCSVASPAVEPCLKQVIERRYQRVVVFPYMLFGGVLVKGIYQLTDQVSQAHPQIQFIKAPYLNDHPKVIESFVQRVVEIG